MQYEESLNFYNFNVIIYLIFKKEIFNMNSGNFDFYDKNQFKILQLKRNYEISIKYAR